MKQTRILVLSALLIVCGGAAFGQAEVAIGVKGGLNFANVNITSVQATYDNRTGYHFGAYAMFKFTKRAIQPEIVFSQQGHTVTFNSQNFSNNYSYVNVPVMLKLYLVAGLNLQAGVQFGFLSSAQGAVYNTVTSGTTASQDVKNLLNSTDFSVPVGIGFDLPFGLNLTARYNIGMSDINKYTGSTTQTTLSALGTQTAKNQVFQLSAGFRLFKLGK